MTGLVVLAKVLFAGVPEPHRRLLTDAGYRDVQVFEEKAHGWICAIGHTKDPSQDTRQ